MVDVTAIKGIASGFGQGDQDDPVVSPSGFEMLTAGGFFNPVLAAWDYIHRPTFAPVEGFTAAAYGKEHPLWRDNYLRFGEARSPDEFEAIASRIEEETHHREVLEASGWGGLVTEIVSGSVSPTLAIPLVGQAKGVKGILQVLAYAGTAASADELALLSFRETYTGEDAVIGIAAGTVLGGLLGSAAKYMAPAERARAVADLEAGASDMGALQSKGAIHYTVPGGTPEEAKRLLPRPSEMSAETKAGYSAEDLKLLEEIEAGRIDPTTFSARSDDMSLSAAGRGAAQTIDTPNLTSRMLTKLLAALNPVTRGATQTESPAARRATLQLADAGLEASGNKDFIPHAAEGTVESRITEYESISGQFILEYDDAYSRYVRGDKVPDEQLQGATTAYARQMVAPKAGKMSPDEFGDEVFRVAQTGEKHEIPEVNKAAKSLLDMFETYREFADEAYEFRRANGDTGGPLFDPDGTLGPGAINYVSHVYSDSKLDKNPQGFIDAVRANAELNSRKSFKAAHEKFLKKQAKLEREVELFNMDETQSRAEFTRVTDELEALTTSDEFAAYTSERLRIQRRIREIKNEQPNAKGVIPEVEELQDELKALRADPEIEPMLQQEAALKADRRALAKTSGKFADMQEELLKKAEALEELDMKALERVMNAGIKLGKGLDKLSDKAQAAVLGKLWKQLGATMKKVETQDKRIVNLYGRKKSMTPEEQFQAYQKSMVFSERRAEADARTEELMQKIEGVEVTDLEAQRQLLRDLQEVNNRKIRDINARRAVRENELRMKAEDYSPEKIAEQRIRAENDVELHRENFEDTWRAKGAEDIDLERGEASFSGHAQKLADELYEKIRGLNHPIAGLELLGGKRGPELARALNLPLEVKMQFLETNPERVARIYARKMAPDIELYRATGSVNAAPVFEAVKEDFRRLRFRVGDSTERPKNRQLYKDWIAGKPVDLNKVETIPFTDEERGKAVSKITRRQAEVETDLRVIVTRQRNQRGVPENPDGMLFRMGRAAKDLNVARYMGSVVLSSIPDIARPVMRYGFQKTLKRSWGTYAKGLDRIQMTRAAARRAGVAWDPVMHNRVQQIMDIADDYGQRKTLGERAIGFVANKTGLVAGFDRWTAEMKQIASAVTIGEFSEGFARVLGHSKGSAKELAQYEKFLAAHGIDRPMAGRIWDQYMLEGGSDLFDDGFRLPNTENWTDLRAKRAFHAALNRAVDQIIVTPGAELPNWADKNMAFSMLAQFKSFTFSSTTRVLLSGAQQSDMALVNGMMFSLALGTVSYYTWAMSIGGDALAEAQKFDPGQWADEAISRSGLLGVFAEPYEIAQRIPATQDLVTFADKRTTRRRATGLLGSVLGPSYDLAEKAANVAMGIDAPTQSTLHQARLMGPWQNVFWFRRAIDAVEDTAASILQLPERREQ